MSICAEESADTTQTAIPESPPVTVDDLVAFFFGEYETANEASYKATESQLKQETLDEESENVDYTITFPDYDGLYNRIVAEEQRRSTTKTPARGTKNGWWIRVICRLTIWKRRKMIIAPAEREEGGSYRSVAFL